PQNIRGFFCLRETFFYISLDKHQAQWEAYNINIISENKIHQQQYGAAEQLAWGTETRKTVKHKQHACISQTSTYERQETANRIRRQPEPGC
ncbi:hypothetical protein, partial [Marseilla massiliensis]|uniref:hypothetical protein n=1 Tax=Marseilla massiliensis TaxID=1841864 RepID=UPI002010F6B0